MSAGRRSSARAAPRRCLFISTVDHRVDSGGGATVTRNLMALLESLPQPYAVDYLPLSRGYGRWRRVHQLKSLLGALLGGPPAKLGYFKSAAGLRAVKARLAAERPALIVVDHADLLWLTPHLPDTVPSLLVAHNVEHALLGRRMESNGLAAMPLLGRWLKADCARLRAVEAEGARRLGRVIAMTPEDRDAFAELAPGVPCLPLAPAFAYLPFDKAPRRIDGGRLVLGFLGNCEWWPNAEGLQWFISEVLPALPPQVSLEVFGRGSERFGAGQRVVGHGFVDSIDSVWERSDLMIAPILSGSGVNVKVAEALYNGLPMLATPLALRGLPLTEDPAVARLETAEDWISLLSGPEARALAGLTPSEATRQRFALDAQAGTLARFLDGTQV